MCTGYCTGSVATACAISMPQARKVGSQPRPRQEPAPIFAASGVRFPSDMASPATDLEKGAGYLSRYQLVKVPTFAREACAQDGLRSPPHTKGRGGRLDVPAHP